MVRSLLSGTKTQTRRVVKPVGGDDSFVLQDYGSGWWPYRSDDGESPMKGDNEIPLACPYGALGDRLWVREAWRTVKEADDTPPRDMDAAYRLWYEADAHADHHAHQLGYGKLRPGMFMPRWASRITLEVTGVRVERLQAISPEDAIAEGIERHDDDGVTYYGPFNAGDCRPEVAYRTLWELINGPGSWDANPCVWVVEFKRVQP